MRHLICSSHRDDEGCINITILEHRHPVCGIPARSNHICVHSHRPVKKHRHRQSGLPTLWYAPRGIPFHHDGIPAIRETEIIKKLGIPGTAFVQPRIPAGIDEVDPVPPIQTRSVNAPSNAERSIPLPTAPIHSMPADPPQALDSVSESSFGATA